MRQLVEAHVLQNFAPSNLNRDDTGAPKDALFGGFRRARISSQCQKRAVRRMFDQGSSLEKLDLAVRTKLLREHLTESLAAKGRPAAEAAAKAGAALAAAGLPVKENGKTEYLLFLGRREIQNLADFIHDKWDAIPAEAKDAARDAAREPAKDATGRKGGRKADKKPIDSEFQKLFVKILDGGKAADVALFGRMLADMPEKNQDAACQVAHAISTHAVEREFDYYTAIDDLKPEDNPGADMIGAVEFNSACFYRYACLDADLLGKNLQGDRDLAKRAVRSFLDAFVRSEPTGKQNSFAAHNPPEFILIRAARDAAPVNLANAFESPILLPRGEARGEKSLTCLSANRLAAKAAALRALYGGAGDSLILNGCEAEENTDLGAYFASWPELLDKAMAILEGW